LPNERTFQRSCQITTENIKETINYPKIIIIININIHIHIIVIIKQFTKNEHPEIILQNNEISKGGDSKKGAKFNYLEIWHITKRMQFKYFQLQGDASSNRLAKTEKPNCENSAQKERQQIDRC